MSGSLGVATVGSSQGTSGSVQAGFIANFCWSGSKSISISRPTSEQYGYYSGSKIIELSGFAPNISLRRAFYRLAFPVSNSQGHGQGARLSWRLSSESEDKIRNIKLEFTQLWEAELDFRLPSSYSRYHGNEILREKLIEKITSNKGPHAILLHGPGGIGKTALVRATLAGIESPQWSRVLGFTAQGAYYDSLEGRMRAREAPIKAKREMYTTLADTLKVGWDGRELEVAHRLIKERILKEGKVIFILDNLESTDEFDGLLPLVLGFVPPPPNGLVIITSRELPDDWDNISRKLTTSQIITEELLRLTASEIEQIIRDIVFFTYGTTSDLITRLVPRPFNVYNTAL